tara:strand:- start:548 stop:826 length:279 start_codon:yes stop_codon:yes gene_type:complete
MKVGDLIRVSECSNSPRLTEQLELDVEGNRNIPCSCDFCEKDSTRMGIILEAWIDENDETSIIVEFDIGERTFWSSTHSKWNTSKIEMINEI